MHHRCGVNIVHVSMSRQITRSILGKRLREVEERRVEDGREKGRERVWGMCSLRLKCL